MKAEIIAVGSELLTPDRTDTNSLYLTARLNLLGIEVTRKSVVGDNLARIQDTFRAALDRVELVVASGGLGPTEDDLTRDAVAELLGLRMVRNEGVIRSIQERFQSFGRTMAENNVRQAMVPEGATILPNARGTAPGLWIESKQRIVILLPGPPRELKGMFEAEVEPLLARRAPALRLHHRELRVAGMPESDLDQRIAPIYKTYADVETTLLASPGEIEVHFRIWSADAAEADRRLDELERHMALSLGEYIVSTGGETQEQVVGRLLTANHATIATAESCTAGLVAERLTRVAGSSAYFLGGVVCYSNELKTAFADVPAEMIETHGAVSPEVARALAEGIRRRTGAALGIGVTGVAGPSGGTPAKPVGTVYIGLATNSGTIERALKLTGDRERIRWQASQSALDMLRRHFLGASESHRGAVNPRVGAAGRTNSKA
ncbi:MAG: competence/damage-inducible protein A [Candidatus Acidiferrales bacterium]